MASKGRDGDSMLVHMTPGEVHGLQALAMKHGGSLTVNPDTGLPEANFLKSLLPMIAGFALGPAGFGLVSSAMGAGAVVGGLTGIATGSLSKGLMAGLGAYGGFGIGEALTGAGADAMTRSALSVEGALPSVDNIAQVTGEGYGGSAASYSDQVSNAVKTARDASAAMPKADLLSAGAKAAAADPFGFAKQNMMPLGMAAAPIVADMMVPTTTKAPSPMAPGRIREKRWNGQYFEDVANTDAAVFNASGRSFSDPYRGYNGGGIVALAEGGDVIRMAGGTPPKMLTDEQLYQASGLTGQAGWEAAAAARDQQNRGMNIYNDFQNLAKTIGVAPPTQAVAVPGVVDVTKPGQYVTDPATGKAVALSAYSPGFDPNNKITQTYLGELAAKGGTDSTSQMFNQMGASQAQKDANAAAFKIEEDRLKALDVAAGRLPASSANAPTGLANLNLNQNLLTNQNLTNQNVNAGLAAIPADASDTYKWFAERGLGFTQIDKSIDNWFDQFTDDLALLTPKQQEDAMRDALRTERMNEADLVKATGKTIAQWIQQKTGNIDTVLSSALPGGVSGGGNTVINPNGTVTTKPDFSLGMGDVRDTYTKGGGSLGYTSPSFDTIDEFTKQYVDDRMSGDSLAAYNYLSGKGGAKYPTKSDVGRIAVPYDEEVLGYPARGNLPFTYDKTTGKMVRNMDYVAPGRDAEGNVTYTMSLNEIKKSLTDAPLSGQALYDWAQTNKVSAQQIADATGRSLSSVYADFRAGAKAAAKKKEDDKAAGIYTDQSGYGGDGGGPGGPGGGTGPGGVGGAGGPGSTTAANPSDMGAVAAPDGDDGDLAGGGMTGYAIGGGLGSLGSYSDGGRLLKGPGDGVSDSIPATIGRKRQPARLADGEFVIPARIVSELGNGSTDAGAKKLYAMMDRVQRARGKTTGKNKVAANSRADKYLPA
jgi:hypothetical protein